MTLSNPTEVKRESLNSQATCRCLGSPMNYCFLYYYPNTYRQALQQNPNLANKTPASGKSKTKQTVLSDQRLFKDYNQGADDTNDKLIDILYS